MSTKGASVNVVNPEGELVSLPTEQVQSAVNAGYRVPAPAEEHELKLKADYSGGLANTLKAGAAGVARGATFGLSDQALTKSGLVAPETLRALDEGNEEASTVGNIAGAVAPMLMTGGASAAAEGASALGAEAGASALAGAAKYAPTKLAAEAATGIGEAATPFAEKAVGLAVNPETNPLAHKILSSGLATGMGSAVEGAAYGLGQSVSEDALGDPDALGEHLMANIGYGALLGGAGGAMFKAGEAAIPGGIAKAKGALDHMASEAEPGSLAKGFAKVSSFVSGKSEDEILSAWKNRALSLHTPEDLVHQATEMAKGLNDQHSGLSSALKDAYTGVRDSETQSALKGVSGAEIRPVFDRTIESIDLAAKKMRSEPDLFSSNVARKLELIAEGNAKRIGENPSAFDIHSALDDLKQQLDDHIVYNKLAPAAEQDSQKILKELRLNVKNALEDRTVFGEAGSRQAAFNDANASFKRLTEGKGPFRKDFMELAISKGGSPVYKISPKKVATYLKQLKTVGGDEKSELLKRYLSASHDLTNQLETTYQNVPSARFDGASVRSVIEKNGFKIGDAVELSKYQKTLNSLGAGAHNTAYAEGGALAAAALGHPAVGAAVQGFNMLKSPGLVIQRLAKIERMTQEANRLIGAGAKSIFSGAAKSAGKVSGVIQKLGSGEELNSYADVDKKLNEVNSNPTKAMDNLESATQWIYHAAPKTSGGLQSAMSNAHGFLQSKLPKLEKSPLSGKPVPSAAEISKFNRYFNTVKNPSHVFEKIRTGMLMPEHMETLEAVYPKMLQQMQAAVMDQLTDKMNDGGADAIPYKTKMMLSMFLGNDLVSSLKQQSLSANQACMTGQQSNQDQLSNPVNPTQGGMKNLSLSSRSMTAMQLAASGGKA